MVWPAIIAAGGQIASQALQKKPKTYTPAQTIMSTVQGARQAGIHPLAALGASPQFQTVSGGVSTGSAVAEGISNVAQAVGQKQAAAPQDKLLAASTEAQLAQAELFRAQSRTLIQNAANAAVGGPTQKAGPPGWDSRKQETVSPMKFFGYDFTPDPDDPSAERAQEWYGEIGELLQSLQNLGNSKVRPGKNSLDRKMYNQLRSWYVRNRGRYSGGPQP